MRSASCCVVRFILLAALVSGCGKATEEKKAGKPPLLCYVGGTMRVPMEELIQTYEKETGQPVELDYGDSGQCLIKIETTGKGDLYVAHDPFLAALMKKGLGDKGWTVASVTPTIAVPKGNPKGIGGLKDLAKPGMRLALTDEKYSTVGHINPVMFEKTGLRKEIEANVVTRARTGGEVANAVSLGNVDAAIVWDAVIAVRKDKLDAVAIEPQFRPDPKLDAVTSATFGAIDMSYVKVTIATLKCSVQIEAARAFAEFVNSPRGRAVFVKNGFSPAKDEAQPAQTAPERGKDSAGKALYLYCGAGIRPPADEIAQAFAAETGVKVVCDYGGSGVLLSKMKLSQSGDLYMPGEIEYIETAEKLGLMTSKKPACYFIPVILVKKGNPKKIEKLEDLARPGLRIGLGNPEACAVGKICEKMFEKNRLDREAIKKNTAFSSVTVNELGIQIKTGQLDATIVWDAIGAYYADCADVIPIPLEKNIISHVAIGALKFSKNPALAEQFIAFVTGEKGKAIFVKHHYTTSLPGTPQ
ncbi:MAG: extracellular solute-binding protein [Planctomycetota bacterium]